jgi:tetratricopeptide (TPR) repeat protein
LLESQEDVELVPPVLVAQLVEGQAIPGEKVAEAMEVWDGLCREVRDTGSLEASKGLLLLTMLLGDSYDRAGDKRMVRALYESALELLRLPWERQAVRGALSRGASLDGDTCSAEVWLTPRDPRSVDLDADTHWRLSRALIDTVHGDWNAVLALLGRTEDELPFRSYVGPAVALFRANAWEQLGRVDTAVEQLRTEIAREPEALEAFRELQSAYDQSAHGTRRLCPRSLELIAGAP